MYVCIVFPCTILIWIINRSWFIFQKFPQFFLIFIHLSIKFSRKYYIVCFHLFLSTYTSVTVLSKLIHTFISFFLPIFSLLCSTNYKRLDRLIRIKFQYMISYIPNIYTRHLTDVYCYSQPYLNFSSQYSITSGIYFRIEHKCTIWIPNCLLRSLSQFNFLPYNEEITNVTFKSNLEPSHCTNNPLSALLYHW